jgi:hypothetical protein
VADGSKAPMIRNCADRCLVAKERDSIAWAAGSLAIVVFVTVIVVVATVASATTGFNTVMAQPKRSAEGNKRNRSPTDLSGLAIGGPDDAGEVVSATPHCEDKAVHTTKQQIVRQQEQGRATMVRNSFASHKFCPQHGDRQARP